jgi:hypothetical protein
VSRLPGGRERRRDARRKDRTEEMKDVLRAAGESLAPLASVFGAAVKAFTDAVAPERPAPVEPPPPAPRPPRRKATATRAAKPKKKKSPRA